MSFPWLIAATSSCKEAGIYLQNKGQYIRIKENGDNIWEKENMQAPENTPD